MKKVILVFAGGLYHTASFVPFLERLEEHNVEIAGIGSSSCGVTLGALYAFSKNLDVLYYCLEEKKFGPKAFWNVENFLRDVTINQFLYRRTSKIGEAKIPLAIFASHIVEEPWWKRTAKIISGAKKYFAGTKQKTFGKDHCLYDALVASCSLNPHRPYRYEYADGSKAEYFVDPIYSGLHCPTNATVKYFTSDAHNIKREDVVVISLRPTHFDLNGKWNCESIPFTISCDLNKELTYDNREEISDADIHLDMDMGEKKSHVHANYPYFIRRGERYLNKHWSEIWEKINS